MRLAHKLLLFLCLVSCEIAAAFEIEMGNVTLNDTFTTPTWTSVLFAQAFPTVPLVVSLPTNQGSDPANIRIRNVTTTGFEILQTEPTANDGPHLAMNTAYLAIEQGTHTLADGSQIIALRHSTTQTISGISGGGWDSIALMPGFPAAPAVVAALQTTRNESASPPSTSSIPFIDVAIRNVTAASLQVSIERAESTNGSVSIAEDIAIVGLGSHH